MCNEIDNKMKVNSSFFINRQVLKPETIPYVIEHVKNSTYWHKFTIINTSKNKNDLISEAVTNFFYPSRVIDLKKTKGGVIFYATHCVDAITKLISNNFKIPFTKTKEVMEVTIFLNWCPYESLDSSSNNSLSKIIVQKMSGEKDKKIDLTAFVKDPRLKQFGLLTKAQKFSEILKIVRDLEPQRLILQKNFLKNLNPMIALRTDTLTCINLLENQITSFKDLEPLRQFKELREIVLSENPICKGLDYVNYVIPLKQMFPNLKTIDNVDVSEGVAIQDNFLCSYKGGDLTEQFLEYFFTMYDKDDRSEIEGLYHENAMFSVTCRIVPESISSVTAKLCQYLAINRNLFSPSISFGSKAKFLFRGRKSIMNLYERLPRSFHDPLGIKTDLISYTEEYAVLVVYGVFQEEGQRLGFARNFVLKCVDMQQYCIVNEQLHVYNASDEQLKSSFEKPQRIQFTGSPVPFFQVHYKELNNTVHLITNLNIDYSRRLLEESHYDLKTALTTFINRHINNEIPKEAFEDRDAEEQAIAINATSTSQSIVQKTIQQTGKFSNKHLWQMFTTERLASTKREKPQEKASNTKDECNKQNGLVKGKPIFIKTEGGWEESVPPATQWKPGKKIAKGKRSKLKYLY